MDKTLRNVLIGLAVLAIAGGLVWTGFWVGRSTLGFGGFWHNTMMGYRPQAGYVPDTAQIPGGMMGGYSGGGMMGNYTGQGASPYGSGMMGGYGGGMMGGGMMGGYASGGLSNVVPLTISQAQEAVAGYLERFNNSDLEIKEVMIFDNQAYAEIVEKSTGIGAMEVLVDPVTLAVYPEYGPNMMWNLKYGMMGGYAGGMMGGGMMGGGMMGGRGPALSQDSVSADMPIAPEKAVEIAQDYLDRALAGTQVEDHADVFYGYYTLHIVRDGNVIGMLSVNGYSGQVFPHTWHGDFIEMSEEEE